MTGNPKIDRIIVGISTLLCLALFGVFLYTEVLYEKPLPENKQEYEKMVAEAKGQTLSESYKVDHLIINLPSQSKRLRFLDINLHITPFKPTDHKILEENKSLINDVIISTASLMEPNDLNTISGKILLESRLRKNINTKLEKDIVKDIYFTHYVVQ
jgi:flagellar protein FliL